jgi:itaconyl-CoA hydratase
VAIVTGLSVPDVSQHAFADLGWEEIRMPHPVFVGDTIYARSTVLDLRESKSRPSAGIVKVFTTGLNQDGADVITWTRAMLTYKRGHGPGAE